MKIEIDNQGFILNPENIIPGFYKTKNSYIKVAMRVGAPNRLGVFPCYDYNPLPKEEEILGDITLEFLNPDEKEVLYCDENNNLKPITVYINRGINRVINDNYYLFPVYNFGYRAEGRLVEIPTKNYNKLNNGKYLILDYGKYQSGLCIIHSLPLIEWIKKDSKNFNLPQGNIEVIYGDFFISKKGTKCFEIKDKKNAKHILISDEWGGAFNSYRGRTLPENGLYFKRARSNGGGAGVDYAIFDKEWKHSLSIDDI